MKKRILFLMADLGGGGAEKVLVNLVNNLDPSRYDITIRTIFGKGVNEKFLKPHIHFSSLLRCKMFGGYVLLSKFFPPRWLYKLLVRDKYDIEIAFMMHVPTRAIGGSDSSANKFAWSHTLHITSKAYKTEKEFLKTYKKFDGVAFVSRDGLQDFEQRYFSHPYGRVVHNAIESDYIKKRGLDEIPISLDKDIVNLCSVGRLSSEKGYLRLVMSLGELFKEGLKKWHLYLLGQGEEHDAIVSLAQSLGIEDKITLLGFQLNPHRFVSKMDLFVCSSKTEGYSTAVTESIILGTPVLTTDCSGMNEIIGDSGAGKIIPNTYEGLKDGIREVLSDISLINEMKIRAKERSVAFSTKNLISEFETFIDGNA